MIMLLCCLSLNKRKKKSITVNLNRKKEKLESGFNKTKVELLKYTERLSYNKHT